MTDWSEWIRGAYCGWIAGHVSMFLIVLSISKLMQQQKETLERTDA